MPKKKSYLTVTDQFCGAGGAAAVIQLSLFDHIPSDDNLVDILRQFGWEKTNYWPETGIYQFKKPGNISNLSRDEMEDLIEKELLLAAGKWREAHELVPRKYRYLYPDKYSHQ